MRFSHPKIIFSHKLRRELQGSLTFFPNLCLFIIYVENYNISYWNKSAKVQMDSAASQSSEKVPFF